MKNIEDIELEFNNYNIKYLNDYIDDKELVSIVLSKLKIDFHKMKSEIYKRLIINEMCILREKILSNIFKINNYSDVYEKDELIINEMLEFCSEGINYFDKIDNLIDDNNIFDLVKLLDFYLNYYYDVFNYFIDKRKNIKESIIEEYYVYNSFNDDRVVYNEFFDYKIKSKVMVKK